MNFIEQEQKRFDEEFPSWKCGCNISKYCQIHNGILIKSFLKESHERLIKEVVEIMRKEIMAKKILPERFLGIEYTISEVSKLWNYAMEEAVITIEELLKSIQ